VVKYRLRDNAVSLDYYDQKKRPEDTLPPNLWFQLQLQLLQQVVQQFYFFGISQNILCIGKSVNLSSQVAEQINEIHFNHNILHQAVLLEAHHFLTKDIPEWNVAK